MLYSLSHWGMCYLGDLRSTYGHTLFFLLNDLSWRLKWCSNKRQFKDIPSNTCLNGSESRVSDPNSWWPRLNAHWGKIYCWNFCFHVVKRVMPILPLLPILCVCKKTRIETNYSRQHQDNSEHLRFVWLKRLFLVLCLVFADIISNVTKSISNFKLFELKSILYQ